jgi:twitching motility protein PilT
VGENRIDRFIEAMHRKNAETLVFATGFPVRLRTDGQERVILDKPVRSEQIRALLDPIGSGGDVEGEEFEYDSPSGRVKIRVRTRGDQISAFISPVGAEGEDEPMTAPEAAENEGAGPSVPVAPMTSAAPAPVPEPEPEPPPPVIESVPGEPSINRILRQLVAEGGSDLHLTTGVPPMIRKDGDIRALRGWDVLASQQIESWMTEVAHDVAQVTFQEKHDADFAHEIPGVARFRMNWFLDRNGCGAVMRTIPSKILTADQLNLPPVIREFCDLPKGLVLVTGPTGSGKSTTLAAMIDLINKSRADHIITIEDPVEFVHRSNRCLVNQREVHTHTKSFSSALRAALREDPDIVLVGEMRDLETVHIAIETAETGHLVFGTLHTNTAPSTVDRIIDQFPTDHQAQIRVMLSESLKGVVSQTLCKREGGGRVACLEILVVNNAVSNLIREGKTFQIPSIMQTAKGQGMQTQIDHMLQLVSDKLVSPGEAFRKAVDQQAMKQALERAGHAVDAA